MAIITCHLAALAMAVGAIPRGAPRCPRCKSTLPCAVGGDATSSVGETGASVPVTVGFWAPWCAPCRMISPVLQELAVRHPGRLTVVKVDVDADPSLTGRFGTQSIPLLVVMRDGGETDRIVGALPRLALEQRLEPRTRGITPIRRLQRA